MSNFIGKYPDQRYTTSPLTTVNSKLFMLIMIHQRVCGKYKLESTDTYSCLASPVSWPCGPEARSCEFDSSLCFLEEELVWIAWGKEHLHRAPPKNGFMKPPLNTLKRVTISQNSLNCTLIMMMMM